MKSKKKKFGLFYFDAGHGHKSAITALSKAIDRNYSSVVEYEVIDIHEKFQKFLQPSPQTIYKVTSKHRSIEKIYNTVYDIANLRFLAGGLSSIFTIRYQSAIKDYILNNNFDAVISTHFFATQLFGRLDLGNTKKINMIMDMIDIHRTWYHDNIDLHLVASEIAKQKVQKMAGNKRINIKNDYFPIDPDFDKNFDNESTLLDLKLDTKKPTVLLTAGGVGMNKYKHLVPSLAELETNLIVVCGKLANLSTKLSSKFKNNSNVKIIGFANNMPELISAADLIITKPGPASIFELLYLNKSGIILGPLGKQETGNYEFALKHEQFIAHDSDIQQETKEMLEIVQQKQLNHTNNLRTCTDIISEVFALTT